jgi:hypothetical protein
MKPASYEPSRTERLRSRLRAEYQIYPKLGAAKDLEDCRVLQNFERAELGCARAVSSEPRGMRSFQATDRP